MSNYKSVFNICTTMYNINRFEHQRFITGIGNITYNTWKSLEASVLSQGIVDKILLNKPGFRGCFSWADFDIYRFKKIIK